MIRDRKVIIDPTSRIWYSSFYIKGLYDVFGKKNVSFSSKYFGELKRKEESHSFDHYMAFVVISPGNIISKFIIDFRDKPSVKESAYFWCDRYGKINFNLNLTDKRYHDKIISIAPGFGIRIWNFWETTFYCFSNLMKCKLSPIVTFVNYFNDYRRQYKRPALCDLVSFTGRQTNLNFRPYVFMAGTLWEQMNCIEGTNMLRKTFIEVCKTLDCDFEGGFFAAPDHPQYKEFEDLIFNKRFSIPSYFKRTKLSAFVFNTPAVYNCHGWKLGEYLAMGKAIVSTPISNQLPEELTHGKNIHIVSTSYQLKQALELLLKDDSYRKMLEDGARDYYLKYCNPEKVIENLIKN